MPSVTSARSAAKFCASPTAPITSASSCADFAPVIRRPVAAPGFAACEPPTTPTLRGIVSLPSRSPFPSVVQLVSARYSPPRAAYAWAPASTDRQSFPVASATASMPFMMPLLWVAARYGSVFAKSFASTMLSRTCSPEKSPRPSTAGDNFTCAETIERSARFETILRQTVPPHIPSRCGARPSHIVLTALAPIASRVSTKTCNTTVQRPSGNSYLKYSMSFAPPPRACSLGCNSFASLSSSSCDSFNARMAASGSTISTIWICPIITGSVDLT